MIRLTSIKSGLSFFFIIAIITWVCVDGRGQDFPSEVWHEGKVVLLKGDTLSGKVKYEMERDILELIEDGDNKPLALTSRKILYFEIFDHLVSRFRYFYALPANLSGSYKVPRIFEVLYEGRLSLLTREAIVTQSSNPYNRGYWGGGSFSRRVLMHEYYFLDYQGKVTPFSGKKKELLDLMKDKASRIDAYIRDNHLRYDHMDDLTKIVAYYNTL